MATAEKERAVQELEERFSQAQALVFTDFRGLDANQMVELRQKLRAQNLEYRVVKNRLAHRAAESAGLSFDGVLEGPTAICFGYDDPIQAFKQSMTLTKEFPNYTIKGGISEGEFVDAEGAKALAELPSYEELLTQLAGTFQGPIRNLAMVLNGMVQQLVIGLNEVAKVKPADADAPEPEAEAEAEAEADAEADAGDETEAGAAAESADEASADEGTSTAEAPPEDDTTAEEAQAESAETDDAPEATAGDAEPEDDEPAQAEASTEAEASAEDEAASDDDSDEDTDEDSETEKGETT